MPIHIAVLGVVGSGDTEPRSNHKYIASPREADRSKHSETNIPSPLETMDLEDNDEFLSAAEDITETVHYKSNRMVGGECSEDNIYV